MARRAAWIEGSGGSREASDIGESMAFGFRRRSSGGEDGGPLLGRFLPVSLWRAMTGRMTHL